MEIFNSFFTGIGKRLSIFRINLATGSILGQLVVSQIWERIGVSASLYFLSIGLMFSVLIIAFKKQPVIGCKLITL
jgi:hypothetical protein